MERKEFDKILRAIAYQLFNRKLPFIVFSGNASTLDEWLFTNVKYETLLVYDSKPEYYYQNVSIKNTEFLTQFYQYFTILLTTPCIVRVVDFLSALSKIDDLKVCGMRIDDSDIVVTVPTPTGPIEKSIGEVITKIDAESYKAYWKSGLVTSPHPYRHQLCYSDLNTSTDGAFGIEVPDSDQDPNHTPRTTLILLHSGLSYPTLDMFNKATKLTGTDFTLVSGYDGDTVLINITYDCELLSSVGTQPSQRWFVYRRYALTHS